MNRLAIVVGGWHWPVHFYRRAAELRVPRGWERDLYVVAHRNPELPIVRTEKLEILAGLNGDALAALDRELYAAYPTVEDLRAAGWQYQDAPNLAGDWVFFNQWLESNDWRKYDVMLNCHDDTYLRDPGLLPFALHGVSTVQPWLILGNGRYPEAPDAYVRGSFEFWHRKMLELIGGRIDVGELSMTREGQTETPYAQGLDALSAWNSTCDPLRKWIVEHKLSHKVRYLSPFYRVSPWVIEGERGFIHWRGGAPWSFAEGLRAWPINA